MKFSWKSPIPGEISHEGHFRIVLWMRMACCILFLADVPNSGSADDLDRPIGVSPDHRFLTQPDGKPLFWLADTAWELFRRLDRGEADKYLKDRADKGFTVIQATA